MTALLLTCKPDVSQRVENKLVSQMSLQSFMDMAFMLLFEFFEVLAKHRFMNCRFLECHGARHRELAKD